MLLKLFLLNLNYFLNCRSSNFSYLTNIWRCFLNLAICFRFVDICPRRYNFLLLWCSILYHFLLLVWLKLGLPRWFNWIYFRISIQMLIIEVNLFSLKLSVVVVLDLFPWNTDEFLALLISLSSLLWWISWSTIRIMQSSWWGWHELAHNSRGFTCIGLLL